MGKVLVVGGGAAGMMAAAVLAARGHAAVLIEQNEKLGKKLYITGKGRCNLTNACAMEGLFENVVTNPRFLYSAFHGFSNHDTVAYFHSIGLGTKVERGDRVFPVSDRSSDVIRVLADELARRGVQVLLSTRVAELKALGGRFHSLVTQDGREITGDACIVATGGLSYPSTGARGDGYRFAGALGHTVTSLYPSLVGLALASRYPKELEGLSLKNVEAWVCFDGRRDGKESGQVTEKGAGNKKKGKRMAVGAALYQAFGELVFTARGVSGPVVLSASSYIAPLLAECLMSFHIDLKPALSIEQLDTRILRDFDEAKNKCFKNALDHLLPQKLIRVIIELSGISPEKRVNAISREERRRLAALVKDLRFEISALGDYTEAVITKGGVDVKEINPKTMESRLVGGVYFVGEVLDVDALTGGYNLQIAWSSGHLAAEAIANVFAAGENKQK